MTRLRTSLGVAVLISWSSVAWAAPPEPPIGASSCTGCHTGTQRVDTAVPRLAGRSAADIVLQMQAFKTGQRHATVMDRIAKGFTESEIQAIADWYAQQK
jgi:cytochrome c553